MLLVLAQAAPTGSDWTQLGSYGVLGLVVLALIFGKIVPGYINDRCEKVIEQKSAELAELRKVYEEKVIPALIHATDVLAKIAQRWEHEQGLPTTRNRQ